MSLRGRHQAANVAVADATLDALEVAGIATADDAARRAGYAAVRWPGRLERLEHDGRELILDGAHNPAGAVALAGALDDLRPFLEPGPMTLLTASMADKDVRGVVAALARSPALRDVAVVCAAVDLPRALPAAELAALWRDALPRGRQGHGRRVGRRRPRAGPRRGDRPDRRRRLALSRRCGPRLADRGDRAVTGAIPVTRIGPTTFAWGSRTYVMGILNVTPDSFSGDGLLAAQDPVATAVATARRMVGEGADLLDIGGESTRPGHATVSAEDEAARVVPVIAAVRAALPTTPISVDTTKVRVAELALDAGADLINDVWGVGPDEGLARLAAARGVPLVVMHNRAEPVYADLMGEIVDELRAAVDRAVRLGVAPVRCDRGSRIRVRQDGRAQPGRPARPGSAARPRTADPPGCEPQVDARQGPGPAGGRAGGGDTRDDRSRDRQWGRHRPSPRRPRPTCGPPG